MNATRRELSAVQSAQGAVEHRGPLLSRNCFRSGMEGVGGSAGPRDRGGRGHSTVGPVIRFHGLSGPKFVEFAEPGFTKIAWGFAASPEAPGVTRVATETRVAATDRVSRRRFRRYWRVVSPFVRLIRRISLRMIQRELERSRRAA